MLERSMLDSGRNSESKGKEWCDGSKGTIYNGKEFNGKKRKKILLASFCNSHTCGLGSRTARP